MFEFVENSKIKYLSYVDNDKILAGVTTRIGGVSTGAHSSLNMGTNTKDSISNVFTNRNRFLESFQGEYNLFTLKQTHSDIIVDLDTTKSSDLEGDGFITTQKNMMIAVTVADCGNIIVTNDDFSVAGVFHAGWKGLENRIVSKGIKLIKEKIETQNSSKNLIAFVGPMITGKNYEVGNEFFDKFDKKFIKTVNNQHFLHTEDVLYDSLRKDGVIDIRKSNLDTFADKENFFSYRRDGETGRIMSFVVLK